MTEMSPIVFSRRNLTNAEMYEPYRRDADTTKLRLAQIGVELDEYDGKVVCENERTSVENVHAIGDVVKGTPVETWYRKYVRSYIPTSFPLLSAPTNFYSILFSRGLLLHLH